MIHVHTAVYHCLRSSQVLAVKQGLLFKLEAIILFWCCSALHDSMKAFPPSSPILFRQNGAPERFLDLLECSPYTEFHGKAPEQAFSWSSVFLSSSPVLSQHVEIPLEMAACQVCVVYEDISLLL